MTYGTVITQIAEQLLANLAELRIVDPEWTPSDRRMEEENSYWLDASIGAKDRRTGPYTMDRVSGITIQGIKKTDEQPAKGMPKQYNAWKSEKLEMKKRMEPKK